MAMPVIRKKPGEKFPIGLRYKPPDLPVGPPAVTISSVTSAVTPAATLVLGTTGVIADGTEVYCWITAGTAGVDYTVRFTSILSDTKILIDDYLVRVQS
jgi:hypothetical protein